MQIDLLPTVLLATLVLCMAAATACGAQDLERPDPRPASPGGEAPIALAIHGGAGGISGLAPEREEEYRRALRRALDAGHAILRDGGTAVVAVVAAVEIMEDDPLFNAGRGAVFTAEGRNELDASIMEGANREAGAVAGVTRVKNPIRLARTVMDESVHVMFAREGAETFAEQHGLEMVPEDYFFTERRYEALQRAREQDRTMLDHDEHGAHALGTVGAVALDRHGNLAAATSTGGMTNKRFGRVGDSPIIGAGTWADNRTCAVSATGHGEFFIRNAVAHDICTRVGYLGESVDQAARAVIHGTLLEHGGTGGVIALDSRGEISMPFNTAGMYRASVSPVGEITVEIYGPDH